MENTNFEEKYPNLGQVLDGTDRTGDQDEFEEERLAPLVSIARRTNKPMMLHLRTEDVDNNGPEIPKNLEHHLTLTRREISAGKQIEGFLERITQRLREAIPETQMTGTHSCEVEIALDETELMGRERLIKEEIRIYISEVAPTLSNRISSINLHPTRIDIDFS